MGQSEDRQINNLDELEIKLGNRGLWTIINGYTFSDINKLNELNQLLRSKSVEEVNSLRDVIKIGIQQNVGVVFNNKTLRLYNDNEIEKVRVTQLYCSALSCGYSGVDNSHWELFARLVLEAAYEASLWAVITHPPNNNKNNNKCNNSNNNNNDSKDVYLTFLGGGVFKNDMNWILQAMARAIWLVKSNGAEMNIKICHYRKINIDIVNKFNYYYEEYQRDG